MSGLGRKVGIYLFLHIQVQSIGKADSLGTEKVRRELALRQVKILQREIKMCTAPMARVEIKKALK